MKFIKLSQGLKAKVSDEDYEYLNQFKWCINTTSGNKRKHKKTYAVRNEYVLGKKAPNKIYMHRLVIGLSSKEDQADHINGNTLDNRRSNLRKVNRRGNASNLYNKNTKTSKYTGVSCYTRKNVNGDVKVWKAQYKHKGEFMGSKCFEYTDKGEKQARKWYLEKTKNLN